MPIWAQLYFLLTLAVLAFGFHKAITAPTEATMGNLYRVFFYHFPHTILSFLFPYLNCGASLLYLFWRNRNPGRAMALEAPRHDASARDNTRSNRLENVLQRASEILSGFFITSPP